MSMDLNWSKVVDWENVCVMDDPDNPGHRTTNPVTYVIGILSIHTGINNLKDTKAAEEFYMRSKLVEACFGGGLLNKRGTTVGLTREDVFAHIGLTSNASPYTEAQFFNHLRKDVVRELRQHFRSFVRDREAEVKARVLETVAGDPELSRIIDK